MSWPFRWQEFHRLSFYTWAFNYLLHSVGIVKLSSYARITPSFASLFSLNFVYSTLTISMEWRKYNKLITYLVKFGALQQFHFEEIWKTIWLAILLVTQSVQKRADIVTLEKWPSIFTRLVLDKFCENYIHHYSNLLLVS